MTEAEHEEPPDEGLETDGDGLADDGGKLERLSHRERLIYLQSKDGKYAREFEKIAAGAEATPQSGIDAIRLILDESGHALWQRYQKKRKTQQSYYNPEITAEALKLKKEALDLMQKERRHQQDVEKNMKRISKAKKMELFMDFFYHELGYVEQDQLAERIGVAIKGRR